jgi:hypothetical protein
MRAVLFALIFFAGVASADEAADRAAVEKTISALNKWPADSSVFTADFDGHDALRRRAIVGMCPEVWWETCGMATTRESPQVVISQEPWGEATIVMPGSVVGMRVPIIVKKIRFLTPDVAMVDAVSTRRLLIVMRREGADWKIASIRELAEQ